MGGAVGAGGNILFGEEEDDLEVLVAAGAIFGATQKAIQSSKKFQILDKGKIYSYYR